MKRTELAIEDNRRLIQAAYLQGSDQLDHERYIRRHITDLFDHNAVGAQRTVFTLSIGRS